MRRPQRSTSRRALALGLALAAALGFAVVRLASDRTLVAPQEPATVVEAPAPDTGSAGAPVANPPVASPTAAAALEGAEPTESMEPQRPRMSFGRQAGLHRVKDPLRLVSSAAIVMDKDSGDILYGKNQDAVLPIASLTKLMTALIVTEGKLPMAETLTIADEDVDRERNSRSRLRVGTTLSRAEALHLALMSSENRAAHALGRTFPGGLTQFVEAMNNRARLLGMNSTTFVDPTGLSNENRSTAHDVALLAAAASKNPLLRDFSTTPQRQVELSGRKLKYLNSNRLVRSADWDIQLQKTGYIIEAGQCVAMDTRIAGDEVVMVLLDATDKGSRSADAVRIKRWMTAQADKAQTESVAGARQQGEKS